MYLRDGLHLSGKGAAVLAEGMSGAVASGLGKVRNLNQLGRGFVEKDHRTKRYDIQGTHRNRELIACA